MKESLKHIAFLFFAGAVIMLGMRTVEWVIKKPDVRLVVCYADVENPENCEILK